MALPRNRRATNCCRSTQLHKHALKLLNDRGAIEFVLGEPRNLEASNHPCLLKEGKMPRHNGAVLNQVPCHILDAGASLLQKNENNLLTHWLCDGLEEGGVK